MTKKQLIETIRRIKCEFEFATYEDLANAFINEGIVTVEPEPEPLECWGHVYEHDKIIYWPTKKQAERNDSSDVIRRVHMREVGKDYQKMWEELKSQFKGEHTESLWRLPSTIIELMESIEKENE